MNYIFDTSFIIDALRLRKNTREILSGFEKSENNLFVPTIVGFELFSGKSSKDQDQIKNIKNFLNYFSPIDLTWKISQRAGAIFRDVTHDLEVPDYIVAATAIEIGAQVVTLNKKHFQKIPQVVIYSN